jgi:hypothetical protein
MNDLSVILGILLVAGIFWHFVFVSRYASKVEGLIDDAVLKERKTWVEDARDREKDYSCRVAIAVNIERNRCANAVQNPEFMHCQGFRMGDRVKMAEKIRSGQ